MVDDHAYRLHEGVDRRRSDELPAPLAQVLRQRRRLWARGGNAEWIRRGDLAMRDLGCVRPHEAIERLTCFTQIEVSLRVVDRCLDLAAA